MKREFFKLIGIFVMFLFLTAGLCRCGSEPAPSERPTEKPTYTVENPTDIPVDEPDEVPTDPPEIEEPAPAPGTSADPSIGTIVRISDLVQQNDDQVTDENSLFEGDEISVVNGGEGLLDFRDQLVVRIFNNTEIGGVMMESTPGTPFDILLVLEGGGITGKLYEEGSRTEVMIPGGASIIIYGTDFFIVHDEVNEITSAGNFNGEMEIEINSVPEAVIPPRKFVEIYYGEEITDPLPIDFTKSEFEYRSRELESPISALYKIIDEEPPFIGRYDFDPDEIWIGKFCPDYPGTTHVRVYVADDVGIDTVNAVWFVGKEEGETILESVGVNMYMGEIGPVTETGELNIYFEAVDLSGRSTFSDGVIIPVHSCIG